MSTAQDVINNTGETRMRLPQGSVLSEQQEKCLSGEHEIDEDVVIQANRKGGGPPRVDVVAMRNGLATEDALLVCKHCCCLYVEK